MCLAGGSCCLEIAKTAIMLQCWLGGLMPRKICFGAVDKQTRARTHTHTHTHTPPHTPHTHTHTHTHTRTFDEEQPMHLEFLGEAKEVENAQWILWKQSFSKNHSKSGGIRCFCGFFKNILGIPRKSKKSTENFGKSVENPWKSVENPWKSVGNPCSAMGIPWAIRGSPWQSVGEVRGKSVEVRASPWCQLLFFFGPNFGYFGQCWGAFVYFGCICRFFGRDLGSFMSFWVFDSF